MSMIIILIAMIVLMYVMMIVPQRKERKEKEAMLASMEIGDAILTQSGFYGVLIDISGNDVIVEFGNNKNCRIPMRKEAIAQVEKPNSAPNPDEIQEKPSKKNKKAETAKAAEAVQTSSESSVSENVEETAVPEQIENAEGEENTEA